jgi:hypothetical protein
MVIAATLDPDSTWHNDFQSIVTSVSGIIYLGTPHGGSIFARIGILQTQIWRFLGRQASDKLLKPLEFSPGSGELHDLDQSFLDIRTKDNLTGLQIRYFYETLQCQMGVCVPKQHATSNSFADNVV